MDKELTPEQQYFVDEYQDVMSIEEILEMIEEFEDIEMD